MLAALRVTLGTGCFIEHKATSWTETPLGVTVFTRPHLYDGVSFRLGVKKESEFKAGVFVDCDGAFSSSIKLLMKKKGEMTSILIYREFGQTYKPGGGCWGFSDTPIPDVCYDDESDTVTFGAVIKKSLSEIDSKSSTSQSNTKKRELQ